MPRILIVDDNIEMARMLGDELADHGYDTVPLADGRAAVSALAAEPSDAREPFDVVVTDLRMPEVDGLQVLAASRAAAPQRPVIVMTAYSAIDTAVEAIRAGAYHYITKPFKAGELLLFIERALSETALRSEAVRLKAELRSQRSASSVVAHSDAMKFVLDVVARVARSTMPVLLTGETGTGKTLIARAIHDAGDREQRPFITVNCAALPEQLLESELFGHVKGAFTSAHAARPGLFSEAGGGTILLDEIGELALNVQAKILHVLERGMIRPVGAEREVPIDVRIIAATNRNLRDAAKNGTFREDLLFRLDVLTIELPPLRKRPEDIVELSAAFFDDVKLRHPSSPVQRLSAQVIDAFVRARWPGNVRELKHVVERLVVLGRDAEASLADVPASIGAGEDPASMFSGDIMPIRRLQRLYAQWALAQVRGNKARAADRLGVDVKTLTRWLTEDVDDKERGDD